MISSVLFMNQDWVLPALLFLMAAALLAAWSYRRSRLPWRWAGSCLTLKLLGVAALVFALLDPHWAEQRAKPGANDLVLLADNSQGMQIKDVGQTSSRGEQLRELLTRDDAPWLNRLRENFQLRRYAFDTRLEYTHDFHSLDFSGRATSLGHSLDTLKSRMENRPLAAVILFTDGNATDLAETPYDLEGFPPIYPVLIGGNTPLQDVAIERVTVNQTVFEDNPVTLQVSVQAHGYSGRKIAVQVFEFSPADSGSPAGPKLIAQQDENVRDQSGRLNFRFSLRPENRGLVFFQIRTAPLNELDRFPDAEASSEATLANNQRTVAVQLDQGPYRLLYVGGRPNWEYKFMNRALAEDDQLELTALIRLAKREPKFEFRGRAGERANPFFRGIDPADEEAERYDQPVLLRLNTRDQEELRAGFPSTAAELFQYHGIIAGSLEAEFFSREQMALLRRFVSERGGGFLMLGGAESFQEGGYQDTPISELLPVYLRASHRDRRPAHYNFSLTREGWLQPWIRLRATEAEEKNRLQTMPPFQVMNRVAGVKPGATALALFKDAQGTEYPGLTVQRFGHGRSAAFTLGDYWRWGTQSEQNQKDLAKSWRQIARWLVSDTPQRIDLRASPLPDDSRHGVRLEARAKNASFEPLENAAIELHTRFLGPASSPTEEEEQLVQPPVFIRAEPSSTEPGLYEAHYVPRWNGAYHVRAQVKDEKGNVVGKAETGWTSDPAAEEFKSLQPNRELLDRIARQTGGQVFTPDALDQLAALLPRREAPFRETWTTPIWHTPAFFVFALACFVGEWGLRRWKGLP
jgi:uncharacterized membrane protein